MNYIEIGKELYFCNPVKNYDCKKTGCFLKNGPCHATTNIKFAVLNLEGKPILFEKDKERKI